MSKSTKLSRFKFHFYNELYRTKIKIHYRIFFSINYNLVVSAPFIKGHKLRKKIRNYEYENDRQRH